MTMRFYRALLLALSVAPAVAVAIRGRPTIAERDSDGLQNIVTWDAQSLFVNGERVFIYSGEFHPFRLPVSDLYLDVFQKIKALGFNAVSFYVNWALLEGEPGVYNASGIFALEPFFDAAQEAGLWLIARPGPYINSELSGGGFPGWLQRIPGELRTRAPSFLGSMDNYLAHITPTIAKAQITNGGPIILLQTENEYTLTATTLAEYENSLGYDVPVPPQTVYGGFPDPVYFAYVKDHYRASGVVVPIVNNDALSFGHFAPGYAVNGSTIGDVNIYGHDSYPLGYECAAPGVWAAAPGSWTAETVPTTLWSTHEKQSPTTPYMINEFEGSAGDGWGGFGFETCALKLNQEFERVFYKNNFANGVKIMSLYMIFGGTNWGNMGYPGGYTSYDEGAAIKESREVTREKYSELKLQANFLKVSPAYLTATVGQGDNTTYTDNDAIWTTPLGGNGTGTGLYIVRSSDPNSTIAQRYTLTVPTSQGSLQIPQLGGVLTLSSRDSKWHVTDYDVGGSKLLYSTAEILTWKVADNQQTNLVVYGGPGELHELAVVTSNTANILEGSGVSVQTANGTTVVHWQTSQERRVIQVGSMIIYILDRNTAYNYFIPDCPATDSSTATIIQAGYLVRSACIQGSILQVYGDLNATVPLKVIGPPSAAKTLSFNDQELEFTSDPTTGEWSSTLTYEAPTLEIPSLPSLEWKYIDGLPEIQASYDDSAWTVANHPTSINPSALQTPTSLYASDYGYNAGILIYRGHFEPLGNESTFYISTQGGAAFSSSVWLNSTYLGSWPGFVNVASDNSTYKLPALESGASYVFTVIVDNQGLEEQFEIGLDSMKLPRGILDFDLDGRGQEAITWKLTGNLRGEQYVDKVRGPLNEGGTYAERQGFHQPAPPIETWSSGSPESGLSQAGINFYSSSFQLDLPIGYDIPLSFTFGNTTINDVSANYTALLFVNGYQYGKYKNYFGPQSSFPVPQGILNYQGTNWLGLELWVTDSVGSSLTNFSLDASGTAVMTPLKAPESAPQPAYALRAGAY